jgi:hypothetical protein
MRHQLPVLVIIAGMAGLANAVAAPVYVGLQDGNGTIDTIVNGANGAATFGVTPIGTSGIFASGSVEGTPPLPEPDLLSNTLDVAGEHDAAGGTISVYVTETNQFPLSFNSYFSGFQSAIATNAPGPIGATGNTVTQVQESIYVHDCVINTPCSATTDVYKLDTLVATDTFTSTGSVEKISQINPGLTAPYAITEVYTVTFAPYSSVNNSYGQASNSISMSVPEPASMAMFGMGMVALGFVRRRRRG